jgi:hypothetical protein
MKLKQIKEWADVDFGNEIATTQPIKQSDVMVPEPTPAVPALPMGGEVAPDTDELQPDSTVNNHVETDVNNYSIMDMVFSDMCEKECCTKTVGLVWEPIELKKFFVFVCNCDIAFKKFTKELEGFARTICYDELDQAQKAYNKILDYCSANETLPTDNIELINTAMDYVAPEQTEQQPSSDFPTEDDEKVDFSPVGQYSDYYDNNEPGKTELGIEATVTTNSTDSKVS